MRLTNGQRLRAAREAEPFVTQIALAREWGIDVQTLIDFERGRAPLGNAGLREGMEMLERVRAKADCEAA